MAEQPIESLDSSSTPADYYNHFKKLYGAEFLRRKSLQGEDNALARSLHALNKRWAILHKKDEIAEK